MALKAGSIIHTARGTTLLERLQNAGPGTVNINKEKIYELGNYQSVGTVLDVPDLTFSMESYDVSTDVEAVLLDVSPDTDEALNLAKARPMNVLTQFKPGQKQPDPFIVRKSVAIPHLTLESASYRFGLRDNATQTFTLRGDSIYYNQGAGYIDEFEGTGVAGQQVVTTHPAYPFVDGGGQRRVLAVVAGTTRLSLGPDFTLTEGAVADDAATVTVTLTEAVPVGEKIRVVYSSPDPVEYPQAVHTPATLKPAAVRGKDIDVYVGGYDPEDIAGSGPNKWTGVQSVTLDWRVTLEKEEEFGNYNAVSQDFEIPTVTGTIDVMPRDADDLFRKLRQMTGVTSQTASIGASTAVPLSLDIVIKDGANGGVTLKRLSVDDARFTVPAYSPRPNSNVTVSLEWESDTGELLIYRDRTAPILVDLEPSTGAAGDSVTILGVNLGGATDVTFGGTPATSFEIRSGREIVAVAPAGTGTVDVVVVTDKGTSTVIPAGEFTYA